MFIFMIWSFFFPKLKMNHTKESTTKSTTDRSKRSTSTDAGTSTQQNTDDRSTDVINLIQKDSR